MKLTHSGPFLAFILTSIIRAASAMTYNDVCGSGKRPIGGSYVCIVSRVGPATEVSKSGSVDRYDFGNDKTRFGVVFSGAIGGSYAFSTRNGVVSMTDFGEGDVEIDPGNGQKIQHYNGDPPIVIG
ncbi:uncharacterized protein UTRI_10234 [Ustilago trichophora]|uniref:Uncharacterized protein n=1 Tax=Ustilago trichophora TaxID=86804 RepID=A0A5C3EH76_9BASI|nr:uncharacterized protein UTRI_10234 [Ustilago trichophora]